MDVLVNLNIGIKTKKSTFTSFSVEFEDLIGRENLASIIIYV